MKDTLERKGRAANLAGVRSQKSEFSTGGAASGSAAQARTARTVVRS
jgi:hypothetical protein